jgi:hypothetical protein
MTTALRFMVVSALALAIGGGCEGKTDPGGNETEGETETGILPMETTQGTPGTTEGTATASNESSAGSETASVDTTDGTTTGNVPTDTVPCGNATYACGNLLDDDGDGFIDLFDPECTGPCDDDESSFQTGLPGDNVDCKQDCFFDGNSGQGDDGCLWDLRCDPANPGANVGCAYTGGNNCNNQPPHQTEACIEFCGQYVPPGCDCFGCCTVQLDDGSSVDIFLNSGPDCALNNLEACQSCTSQIDDCGTPCVPEECHVCFGESEPPPGCGGQTCPSGQSCDGDNPNCPEGYFCYLGCCYPPPPG